MKKQNLKNFKLPDKPGVYFFIKGKSILYVGKATSLRDRVKSYFSKDLIVIRGPLILDMVTQADNIKYEVTDSVLEALILESNLIKKFQPKYNTKEKDNKSFNYVCITRDKIPRVLIVRGRGLDKNLYNKVYGPFPNGSQLREAMKIIRRIFPYFDNDSLKKNNKEFYKQLGLIPDIVHDSGRKKSSFLSWSGSSSSLIRGPEEKKLFFEHYGHNIKNLKLFFEGKKKSVILNFKKEMLAYTKRKEFEKANDFKKKIFALEHINDVALIKSEIAFPPLLTKEGNEGRFLVNSPLPNLPLSNEEGQMRNRIEAYDIAHMSGKNMVGVMTVIENGEVNKSEYKKFIIRTQKNANDTGALEEVLSRRFRHTEWGLPSLIVVDGSTAQLNVAKMVLSRYQFNIPVVGVVKDDKHKAKAITGDENIIKKYKNQILLANSESHRFAINFHKQKRNKSFLNMI